MSNDRNDQPLVSLIVPTLGRCDELDALLRSIGMNGYKNVEIIIVDQNGDDRLLPIVDAHGREMDINHLRVDFTGATRARNHGASAAKGDIISFPDDDSYYAEDTIGRSVAFLVQSPEYAAVSGKVVSPGESRSMLNYLDGPEDVTVANHQKTTLEFSLYWRKSAFSICGGYDEDMGVGRYFGAEESSDLVIRAIQKGLRIRFEPGIAYYHPSNRDVPVSKTLSYARGTGRVLYKHRHMASVRRFGFGILMKSLIGTVIYFPGTKRSRKYSTRARGILIGFHKTRKMMEAAARNS